MPSRTSSEPRGAARRPRNRRSLLARTRRLRTAARRPATRVTRRQALRIGLAGALGAGSVAALAAGGAPAKAPSNRTTGKAKVTINMWSWYNNQPWGQLISAYQDKHSNVTINNRIFGSLANYTPAIEAAVSAGSPPDLIAPATLALSYGKGGILLNLTKELGHSFLKQFFESTNAEYTFGGKQYAVGWNAQTFGVFYNPSLLGKAGVDGVPETWDDLVSTVEPIRSKTGLDPMILNADPSNNAADFFLPLITQVTNDPTYVLKLDQQIDGKKWTDKPVVTALGIMEKLVKAKVFEDGPLAVQGPQAEQLFYTQKAPMLFLGSWVPQDLQVGAPTSFVSSYKVAETPTVKSGGKHWTGNQAGSGWGVSAHSKHLEAAIDWLKFMYEPKRYADFNNASHNMPSTKEAAPLVSDPVVKQMTSWLVEGRGCPHILFGAGSETAVGNGVQAVINGSASPHQAAHQIQSAVEQAQHGAG